MRRSAKLCFLLAVLLCRFAGAQSPQLHVFPPSIQLDSHQDSQSLVVQLVVPDGVTRDVSSQAQLACASPALVRFDGPRVFPLADGESTVTISVDAATAQIPVAVRGFATPRSIRFKLDVMPIFAKDGCNSGSCHGSARGQDGFRLSLFGYDPDGDYLRLTRELPGRRINLALPADSLLLQKATESVPHTGGKRIEPNSANYATLLEWLRAGAPDDPPDTPRVTGLEVFPREMVLAGADAAHHLVARATYSDGSDRDVSALTTYRSSNETSATVDAAGLIRAGKRGEAQILARFDAFAVGASVIVIPPDAADPGPPPGGAGYIDQAIGEKLRKLRVLPSEICTDETFLRRAYLDLVGLLPSPEQTAAFLADARPDRRERLVDDLLSRKEFVEIWVLKWAERLNIRSTPQVSYKATLLYYDWLQERIAGNMPINRIVAELITSSGGTFTNPATNFYQLEQDTLKLSEGAAQSFLGVRLQCAQCHNHPFDRWTMNDYYGFAAFFSQIGRKPAEDPRETIVFNSGGGDVKHPVGGRVMAPTLLGGPTPDLAGRDRREVLAQWLTARENRMFSRNVANFVWAHFFGRGVVNPIDDVRVSNPPVNEALLDALAEHLIAGDYDLRKLVRDICTSQTYQRSTVVNASNADDGGNFSHALVRPLRAETLLDCISEVTRASEKFQGLPRGARAVQIADGSVSNTFLSTFGRVRKENGCACSSPIEPSLSQALHLINGDTVHRKIQEGRFVRSLLEAKKTPAEIIDEIYLSCLVRKPADDERQKILATLAGAPDPAVGLEDIFWAVLNSREFVFNH